MPSVDEIRTLTIKAVSDGLDQATDDLNKLAAAQAGVAVVSDTTTKATTSVSNALQKQQTSLDTTYRAQSQFNKSQLDITRGYNEGLISLDRYNQLTALNQQRLDSATQSHSAFQRALTGVSGQLVALSAGAGPVGTFLAGLGPWGVAAAAGLGALASGFSLMSDAAEKLAGKAAAIRNFATVTELSATQIQALIEKGADFALSGDQVTSFIERFTTTLSQARNAQGPYYDKLREINPALAQQVLTTKSVSEQVNILAAAYKLAGANGNELLKTAGGKGGVANAPLVQAIGNAGGLDNLPPNPSGMSAQMIDQLAKLDAASKVAGEHIRDNLSMMFSGAVLQNQKEARENLESLSKILRDFSPSDAWERFTVWTNNVSGGLLHRVLGGKLPQTPNIVSNDAYPYPPQVSGLDAPTTPAAVTKQALANQGKATLGALGSAASDAERYNQRIKELNVSLQEGVITQTDYNRAVGAAGLDNVIAAEGRRMGLLGQFSTVQDVVKQKENEITAARVKGLNLSPQEQSYILSNAAATKMAADLQIKAANDVATADGMMAQKKREVDVLVAAGKLTQDEANTSLQAYVRTTKDAIDAQEVRKSSLPGLTQLALDAGNANKQLDTFATTSLNSVSPALQDMMNGTTTLSSGFQNLGLAVVKALQNMVIQMTIVQPIAAALKQTLSGFGGGFNLSSLFGGGSSGNTAGNPSAGAPDGYSGASALGNVFSGAGISAFSNSIVNHPTFFRSNAPMAFASGGSLMGEAGPEAIIPLKRGTDGRLGVSSSGGEGSAPVINLNISTPPGTQTQTSSPRKNGSGWDMDVIIQQVDSAIAQRVSDGVSDTGRAVASVHGLQRKAR